MRRARTTTRRWISLDLSGSPNADHLTWPLLLPPGGLDARQVNLQAGWSPAWIPRELLYYLLLLLLQPASGLKEA